MAWAKIDDQFYMSVKNSLMDRDEQDLYLAGIVYCNGQLSDGFIPATRLTMLCTWAKLPNEANAQAIASHLVEHGFWEVMDNGYMVHDFLDWNMSRAEIIALREARSEAGKRGGQASGVTRKAQAEANEAKHEAIAQAKSKQNRTPYPYQSSSFNTDNDDAAADPEFAAAISAFQNSIALVANPMQAQEMSDAIAELQERNVLDWWHSAVQIACDNNKRSWSYVRAIIVNSLKTNHPPGTDKPQRGRNGSKPAPTAADLLRGYDVPAGYEHLVKS